MQLHCGNNTVCGSRGHQGVQVQQLCECVEGRGREGGGREEGGRGGGGRVFGWPNFTEGSYLVALQTCISLNDSEGCKNVVVNTTCPESLRAHTPGV